MAVLAALALLPPTSHAGAPAELRVAIQGDIKGTNPGVTRDGNTDTVIHHVVESLVAYGEDLEVEPLLAERIDVSPDLRRFTFHLRRDVRFHNGAPMTAREVQWSWQRILDPSTRWRCRHWYDGTGAQGVEIDSITAPDPHTVVFELAAPSSAFLDRMANVQCVTAILHPDSVFADGSWRAPVGTGPYVLHEWRRGEYVLLSRFDDYVARAEPRNGYAGGRRALVPHVRFMVVGDPAVGVAGILSDDIDVLPLLPLHLAREFERRGGVAVQGVDQLSWSVLLLNPVDSLLKDVRLRRAIAHAISLDEVATISSFGRARSNPSAVPTRSAFYTPTHRRWWPYDPAKARALLEEAGYDGAALRLQTNRKIPFMFENAVAIQAMLVAAGMNVELEVVDWATQLDDYYAGSFQMSAFGYSGRTHPVLNYAVFLGDRDVMSNAQWENGRALELLEVAEQVTDRARQIDVFEQIHLLMFEDVPLVGLFNEYAADVTRDVIEGYEPWALGRPRLWGVQKLGDTSHGAR